MKNIRMNNRVGETNINNQGEKMIIIEYNNNKDILVMFEETKAQKRCVYSKFIKGSVTDPYYPSVHGVGYIGNTTTCDENGNTKTSYSQWRNIIDRCYNPENKNYNKYGKRGVHMCEEWFCYECYERWYNNNVYDIDGTLDIDKDIILKHNKIYSPDTCVLVPHRINMLFVKSDKTRGNLPIGVYYREDLNKYESTIRKGKSNKVHLGIYKTPEDAFIAYKQEKEKYIKEVANEYKNIIPLKLYNAMIKYEVEIDD